MKEVALAKIIQPSTRDMHHTRMSEAVMKVTVTEVLPEFRDIDPPTQPPGADEHLKLGECKQWMLEWPKTQIRLGDVLPGIGRTGGATSRPRLPIVRPPSRRPPKAVAEEPTPQADVASTQKAPAEVATTGRKPPPPVAGRKLPPVVASSRHKLLLGTSSAQPPPQADDATTAKVSSDFLEFPDFPTFPTKLDVGLLMFRTKPLHLNLLATQTTTMRRTKRMMSTSMTSSTLAPAGMICSCLLWMKNPSATTALNLLVQLHAHNAWNSRLRMPSVRLLNRPVPFSALTH